jgi:formylglycine-generating enzyme required for sulfatase activity
MAMRLRWFVGVGTLGFAALAGCYKDADNTATGGGKTTATTSAGGQGTTTPSTSGGTGGNGGVGGGGPGGGAQGLKGQGESCGDDGECASGNCAADGACGPPSCAGGLDCGGTSCCDVAVVSGGPFPMGRGAGDDACLANWTCDGSDQPEHTATVSPYRLDTFEITVGRFRKFVAQYDGFAPPADGAGASPTVAGSGWSSAWNDSLPATGADLVAGIQCAGTNWSDSANSDRLPMNCITWFEAFAYCIWDGGRLPTEAEWEYAAAGGLKNHMFPWGPDNPSTSTGLANDVYSDYSSAVAVGSHPSGDGDWGHHDLAGSVREWTLDWYDAGWYAAGGNNCVDCANVSNGSQRSSRGGSWGNGQEDLRSAVRTSAPPSARSNLAGVRCARNIE